MHNKSFLVISLLIALLPFVPFDRQQTGGSQVASNMICKDSEPSEQERHIRAQMEFLASDALQGRESATQYELITAHYIAAQLRGFGIEPAGDASPDNRKHYLQTANFTRRRRDPSAPVETGTTRNVIGVLRGSDAQLARQAIVLSAHMDHVGVRGDATDSVHNGADDNASGVVAVLELARTLSSQPRPKRTIYFVFFGSGEIGGYGATHFLDNPPVPLTNIVANLNFEMIGRPDAKVAAETLWLTGYERSNLGAELARRGARLVADPRPEQNFFRRSDNYKLAQRGIVAHTVSSFGLHAEYHQPSDDLSRIDFAHMTRAIASMTKPVVWLANSDFVPAWVENMKP